MWAKIMRERFGAQNPRSWMLRFHTQTCGCTLTAQQPLNNIVRVAYQALAAVLGGTQSLHTNAYDEALGLPTEESATIALRTQQILAEETGVADTADPLGGSYFVEALTDEIERRAWELIEAIEALGGAVTAIERGWVQAQIAESAYQWEAAVERGERVVVGVNRYQDAVPVEVPVHRLDEAAVERQIRRVQEYRARQDAGRVERALARVEEAARGTENLLPVLREALLAGATLGQICGRLRQVWGEYRPRF